MRIDFRSDTVTLPSASMKEAMINAPLGDDVFDDDPSVHELQELAAGMFGMEDALFCCSGTQTNQIAIKVHTRTPGEVICHSYSHIYKYEGGGVASNSGVACYLLGGDRGILHAEDIEKAIKMDDVHFPESQLISLENTCNKGGGSCYTLDEIKAIRAVSLDHNIPLHLDGARLANAIVAKGYSAYDIGQQFDSISLCLSKGLGAPVGSVLLGSETFIKQARRIRKTFGGGMRQAGIIAKAGTYALQNNVKRLADDHQRAQYLAREIETFIATRLAPVTSARDLFESQFANFDF